MVKTASVSYSYDTINSGLPNEVIGKIKQISLSAGPDSMSPMITAEVNGAVRIPNQNGPGDGSIILLFSSVGRVVVNGTSITPAVGELSSASLPDLYSKAISAPLEETSRGEVTDF